MSGSQYGANQGRAMRFETYARSMRVLAIAAAASAVASMVAIGVAVWSVTSQPEPRYFATQVDGQLLPLVPLNEPHLTDNQVTNFAVEAVTRALTMDFQNWRQDLNDSKIYFQNPQGFDNFLEAITQSGNLDLIRNNRMTSSVVANGAVIVEVGRSAEQVYTWRIEVPLTITYESSSQRAVQDILAYVEIIRLPTYENPYGVGVSRFIARPR